MTKRDRILRGIGDTDRTLAAARAYLARGVNVRGSAFLHFDDWQGRSGHPLWMRNHMIPSLERRRAEAERTLERIERKETEKARSHRQA